VQALKAQGVNVINLTAGEPDFAVNELAKQAVMDAVHTNKSKYTPVPGIPELRTLVAQKTNGQQPSIAKSHPWKAANVVVANGGKQAIFNTLFALLDSGEEVLIPAPYWLSYPDMTKLVGGVPRFIHAGFESGFKITPNQLKQALQESGSKARVLVLNSPSNPTGAMYSKKEFAALGKVILETPTAKDLWVISDEIYDQITFGEVEFCSFLESTPELRDRVVTVNGMSKSAAMTGWRIGWTVAHEELTSALITLQGQSTSGINSLAQWASVAALKASSAEQELHARIYRRRRDLALEILKKTGKLKVRAPEGAFYFFVGLEGMKEDSIAFSERLLNEAKVAVVPGTPFGAPDYIRLSFATDDDTLREGCERIVKFIS
jgi:aspartate aminotransferase